MQFTKMHGAGNDYVYVDCFAQPLPQDPAALARAVSDRHTGIGGDGLILICPSPRADAEMRMFNADGSPSQMCGNGVRCVAKYVYDHGLCKKERLTIESAGRMMTLDLQVVGGLVERVRVDMGEPILDPPTIPTLLRGEMAIDAPLDVAGYLFAVTAVSMGNPHCVIFVERATDDLVLGVGPQIERDPAFPQRVNVEWVEVCSPKHVRQRTWERGSGETQACGSGACAVCVAGVLTGRTERRIAVELLGGELEIEWSEGDNHVYMTGPAAEVFQGVWPD